MKFSRPDGSIFWYMKSSLIVLLLNFFCFNLIGQNPPNVNIVENPEEFQWAFVDGTEPHYVGIMEVGEATFNINGETLTTRAYRQKYEDPQNPGEWIYGNYSIPGPTMRVSPGNKYILKFHNTLPYEPLSEEHNVFKDPNVSNMHTHGLHISGESPGDDVTRSFEGGRGGDFVYDIPIDHMGGTYWYHAHHHGSTFLQVAGGLFGMLIVDDSLDGIPENVAAMDELEIIFGYLDPSAAGTGGDVIMDGTLSATWTVNGLVEGNILTPPNTWQHWRVLIADRASNMKTLEFGPGVEVMLLARDGVWRTVAPKEITTNQLEITGASRADFAIRATTDSWIKVDGTVVANIYINGESPNTDVSPFDYINNPIEGTWSANRPDYLRDLRGITDVNAESISMGARTINGSKFNINEPTLSLNADKVQEWSLSGAVQHPFHLHVYHVQALRDDNGFEAGEYYDVVASKMSVRFDLNSNSSTVYSGKTILHCHILSHEDRGAMGWLDVLGGDGPPTYPVGTNYSEYYTLDGTDPIPTTPSNLLATATSSSAIDLVWSDNSFNEDGFNIERSTNGTAFSLYDSVASNEVTYSDNGLNENTTYWYRVSAYNVNGNSSYSNIAEATTQQVGGGPSLYVNSININRISLNGNRFRAEALISIFDDSNNPVSGVTVSGEFSGLTVSSESGITDSNGEVVLNSKALKNPNGEWCFTVNDVNLNGVNHVSDPYPYACENSSQTNKTIQTVEEHSIKIFPNPFKDKTNISFQLLKEEQTTLDVYSLLGVRIGIIANHTFNAGIHLLEWDASHLSSGIYILKFKTGKKVITKRVILTN